MAQRSDRTICYDIRRCWERDLGVRVRPAARADAPGLARIHTRENTTQLVECHDLARLVEMTEPTWTLERRHRVVGLVAATVTERKTAEAPHPWSHVEADALEDARMPCLVLDCAFWERSDHIEGPDVLRDTVCNATQRRPYAEVRVSCRLDPEDQAPEQRLMTLHAGFAQARWNDHPIATFLRADFELQGWYHDDRGRPLARLTWRNRAR